MLGQNPIRTVETHEGAQLDVVSIFPTLQGEGPNAGMPAIFIRLGGCNLACDFCDTEFENFSPMPVDTIVSHAQTLAKPNHVSLCVITGGEPLRQPVESLCESLLAAGFRVQIETNGTVFRPLPDAVEIVCSPKNTGQGYFPVREDLLKRANALKFVVSAAHPLYCDIAEVGQARTRTPVYIQPMDEYDTVKNAANRALAIELAKRYNGRLSLQLHKVLGIE